MKVKTARRAFGASLLALILCFAMLVGTTFAWFTDSASTNVNRIQSGILQIDLASNEGTEDEPDYRTLVGETLGWHKAEGHEEEELLWEPGVVYDLDEFYIVNEDLTTGKISNLALKYNVEITGILGDEKLLEAIDFTVTYPDDTSETGYATTTLANFSGIILPNEDGTVVANGPYTIQGHMKAEVGNEYQDLSIDGIAITVYATQYNYEFDSNTDLYDLFAQVPHYDETDKIVYITSAAELKYAMNHTTATTETDEETGETVEVPSFKGYTLSITNNIDLTGYKWVPVVWGNGDDGLDMSGTTINGNGNSIIGLTVTGGVDANGDCFGFIGSNKSDITIKDLTFKNSKISGADGKKFIGTVIGHQYGDVKMENVTVENSNIVFGGKSIRIGGLVGYSALDDGAKLTLTNCVVKDSTFQGYHTTCGLVGTAKDWMSNGNLSVSGCQVNNCTFTWLDPTENYYNYGYVDGVKYTVHYDTEITGVTFSRNTGNIKATANSQDKLTSAIAAAEEGETITLDGNVTLTGNLSVNQDVTIDGQGNAISGGAVNIGTENNVTFKNVDFSNTSAEKSSTVYGKGFKGTVTFDGCTFGDNNWEAIQIVPEGDCTIVIKNCTFNDGDAQRFIHVQPEAADGIKVNVTIKNNVFNNCDKIQNAAIDLDYLAAGSTMTLGSNKFYMSNGDAVSSSAMAKTGKIDFDRFVYFCTAQTNAEGDNYEPYTSDDMYGLLTRSVSTTTVATYVEAGADATETQTNVNDAINNATSGDTVVLPNTENGVKLTNVADGVTIKGDGTTKIDATGAQYSNIANVNGAVLEGLVIDCGNTGYHGFQHSDATFKNCTINGRLTTYDNQVFENCTFNQDEADYNMWAYSDVTCTNCTFNNSATGKFVNVYTESGGYEVNFDGCTFNNTSGTANKAAINVKDTSGTNQLNYVVNITNCTTSGAFPAASTGTTLVVISSVVQVDDIVGGTAIVNVDDNRVYPAA